MAGMYGILEGYFIQIYPFQNCYFLFTCPIFGVLPGNSNISSKCKQTSEPRASDESLGSWISVF